MKYILIPMDRLGVVSVQKNPMTAVRMVNQLLKEGKAVYWLTKHEKLITEQFPEGHIYGPGAFLVEDAPEVEENLQNGNVFFTKTTSVSRLVNQLNHKKIAFYLGKGCADFCKDPLAEVLGMSGFDFEFVSDKDIRSGLLDSFDTLLVPGGPDAGESFYWGLGDTGYNNIKNFVANKGQYFGICAGAYLALTSTSNENRHWLGLVDATDEQDLDYWRTGTGFTRLEIVDPKHPFSYGMAEGKVNTFDIVYWEGPAFKLLSDEVKVLATFKDFVASGTQLDYPKWDLLDNTPAIDSINNWYNVLTKERFDRHLKDKPAMIESRLNNNKILLYSPHAEFGNIGITSRRESQVFQLITNGLFYLAL